MSFDKYGRTRLLQLSFFCVSSQVELSEFPAIKFRAIPRASLAAKATTSPSTADQISGLKSRQKQKLKEREQNKILRFNQACKCKNPGVLAQIINMMSSIYRSLFSGYLVSVSYFLYPLCKCTKNKDQYAPSASAFCCQLELQRDAPNDPKVDEAHTTILPTTHVM